MLWLFAATHLLFLSKCILTGEMNLRRKDTEEKKKQQKKKNRAIFVRKSNFAIFYTNENGETFLSATIWSLAGPFHGAIVETEMATNQE